MAMPRFGPQQARFSLWALLSPLLNAFVYLFLSFQLAELLDKWVWLYLWLLINSIKLLGFIQMPEKDSFGRLPKVTELPPLLILNYTRGTFFSQKIKILSFVQEINFSYTEIHYCRALCLLKITVLLNQNYHENVNNLSNLEKKYVRPALLSGRALT